MPGIIFFIGQLDIGGAERHLTAVLPKLVEKGYAITIVVIKGGGPLQKTLEEANIPVHSPDPRWPRKIRTIFAAFLLRSLIYKQRPCVVHFFLPGAYLLGGLCSLSISGCKRLMSRRSLNDYQKGHPIFALIERWLHPRMDGLVGNSQSVICQLIDEGAPAEKVGLLYSGVERQDLDAYPSEQTLRREMNIGRNSLIIVVIANLIPYKGHVDLISALDIIKEKLPKDWTLLLVGEDRGIWETLWDSAKTLCIEKHIRFVGLQDDVNPYLKVADIAVLPSHQEGFSNALLEYMAAGKSIVATEVGGNSEVIRNEHTGLLVPPRDPERLGAAIVRLANDRSLRQRLGQQAKRYVVERFSVDSCVSAYERLYHAVTAGTGESVAQVLPAGR